MIRSVKAFDSIWSNLNLVLNPLLNSQFEAQSDAAGEKTREDSPLLVLLNYKNTKSTLDIGMILDVMILLPHKWAQVSLLSRQQTTFILAFWQVSQAINVY